MNTIHYHSHLDEVDSILENNDHFVMKWKGKMITRLEAMEIASQLGYKGKQYNCGTRMKTYEGAISFLQKITK